LEHGQEHHIKVELSPQREFEIEPVLNKEIVIESEHVEAHEAHHDRELEVGHEHSPILELETEPVKEQLEFSQKLSISGHNDKSRHRADEKEPSRQSRNEEANEQLNVEIKVEEVKPLDRNKNTVIEIRKSQSYEF